jgi:hypothetical protein
MLAHTHTPHKLADIVHPRIGREDGPHATMVAEELGRLKWFLRHGNVFRALQTAEDLEVDLDVEDPGPEQRKLQRAVAEFSGYIRANAECIPTTGSATAPARPSPAPSWSRRSTKW